MQLAQQGASPRDRQRAFPRRSIPRAGFLWRRRGDGPRAHLRSFVRGCQTAFAPPLLERGGSFLLREKAARLRRPASAGRLRPAQNVTPSPLLVTVTWCLFMFFSLEGGEWRVGFRAEGGRGRSTRLRTHTGSRG